MTSPATYRCTACGREFGATSAYVRHGLSHLIDPTGRSPRVCFRGRMEPVAPVVIDTARDDRAGVTLPTAIQPVGGDQLVPGGAGQGDGEGDAGGCGHKDNIATGGADGHVNRPMATHAHVSVSAKLYARLTSAREARGESITSIVEAALAELHPVDAPAVPVSAEVYRAVGNVARRDGRPMAEVLDAAINKLLDDAARWCEAPGRSKRAPRTPRVDHAYRGAR